MDRQCSRTGCTEHAVTKLSYQYARRVAWLDDAGPHRDPHAYDLCERHAGRLTVPTGWDLEDRRAADTTPARLAG